MQEPVKTDQPVRIPVPGGKLIEEFVGRASTGTSALSIAHMVAPSGWSEPHQTPAFNEVTIVVRGRMRVEHGEGGHTDVSAGETILVPPRTRIRYSTPFPGEAEYWAVCTPAFTVEAAKREE